MIRSAAHPITVEAWRGDRVESRHEVHWARHAGGVDAGDASFATFWRSAAKPFQLLPLLMTPVAAEFDAADIAVMAGSHDGTDAHAARVASILQRLGAGESDLRCGEHRPYFLDGLPARSPERLRDYGPLHNNCSGNHAAMLGLARAFGVERDAYLEPRSRSQEAIHQVVEAFCGVEPRFAEDSCAAPCYFLPLARMAEAFALLARPSDLERLPEPRRRILEKVADLHRIVAAVERLTAAIAEQPEWVTGAASGYTRVVRAFAGRVLLKHGADGVLCVAHRDRREGIALKVRDGNERALVPALLHLAARDGWLEAGARQALSDWIEPRLFGRRGQVVGGLRVAPMSEHGG
jgi:L-asparaginase II